MRAFIAIAKLTCRATLRSYVFHFLFLLLLAVILILPNAIVSDGTARGLMHVSLKYCLGISGFILSISTIWVSCFALSNDIETYQIHMLTVKPVSRIWIWLGKLTGIVFLHGVLLLFASLIIYGFTMWQFSKSSFLDQEKDRIRSEVLVGRRVYMPDQPDFSGEIKKKFKILINAVEKGSVGAPEKLSIQEKKQFLKDMAKQLSAQYGEIMPGQIKKWTYRGLDPKQKEPLSIRYRIYVGKVSSKDQRETYGIWSVIAPVYKNEDDMLKGIPPTYGLIPKSPYPEKFMCGVFFEERLSPSIIAPDGTVTIAFQNFDTGNSTLFFQSNDGPKLLEKRSGFLENYLRAVFMIFLRIILLAGLGASAGALLSMPVAVFFVISYLLFGMAATFVVDIERDFAYDIDALENYETLTDTIARRASHALLTVVIPMQKFEASDSVADGELIEFSFITKFIFEIFIIRGLPIFALAAYLYKRREIGLVIKK